ncbi:MAG: Gfo/Idh/MocA family oxidoreductase [Planctomycetes bacterium]|nr:Gfo/Idh/MocA family oxidoreductase [Planctomycetota bacterium]
MNDPAFSDLRIAIFGCGRMGKTRARCIEQLGGRIAFAYDVDPGAARTLGGGARVLDAPGDLDLDALDALFVCTPPGDRGTVELAALRHGHAVFVEKPLAVDLDAARPWVEAAAAGAGVTAVGYMNRYRSAVERALAVVRDEPPLLLCGVWASGKYARDWWLDPARSGGPLNEQMSHLLDLLRALGGEIATVAAAGPTSDPRTATDAAVALTFAGDHAGTIAYSCRAETKGIGLRVVTPSRTVQLEGWDFRDAATPDDEDPFLAETAAFLAAAASKAAPHPRSEIADAARTQAVADAVAEALRSGRRVAPSTP